MIFKDALCTYFDKEDNLLAIIFMIIKNFEMNNWQKYPVIAFQEWPKKTP